MPRGRRPGPGTQEERAAARREKVRLNVQAFRRRQAGLKDGSHVPSKPALRWVEDTKWQAAYDQHDAESQESGIQPHTGSTPSDESRASSGSASSPSTSFVYETPSSELTDESALVRSPNPTMLATPSQAKQDLLSMLSIFPTRFLPDRVSLPTSPNMIEEIRTPCAFWVTTAYSLASQRTSGPLNDVLLAITTALASLELGRVDLQIASHRLYLRSLRATRKQLQPIIEDKKSLTNADAALVFLACHAASVFELYVNKSFQDMNRHVQGIGLLIKHQRKFPDFPAAVGDNLMEEYRMIDIGFAFIDRRLPATQQLGPPLPPISVPTLTGNPRVKPGTSIFTTLLNIADHIPFTMIRMDELKRESPSPKRDRHISSAIQTLLGTHAQLERWSRYLQYKCLSGSSPGSEDGISLPDNEVDIANIHSYDYACSWLFCLSYEVYALDEMVEASALLSNGPDTDVQHSSGLYVTKYSTDVLRSKLIDSAGKLAQLNGYFFQLEQGIIGRSLAIWPLEACWNALEKEWARLEIEGTELRDEDDEFAILTENDRRRAAVVRSLQLCKSAAVKAQFYGLPVMKERT